MAWRAPATPPEGHTNTRIQHANYVAERCTPRYYRILTTPVHTSPVRINPKGPCRPLLASEQHMVSSRGKPPPRGQAPLTAILLSCGYSLGCIGFRDPRRHLGQRLAAEACSTASLCSSCPLVGVDCRGS